MSMAGIAILHNQVCSDVVLFGSGPRLSQSQVADLTVGLGCFQPPLAKASFKTGRLKLLVKEVDLAVERLALLIHCSVSIDLGHKPPVMDGEFVKLVAKCGVGGPAPSKSGNKPCG